MKNITLLFSLLCLALSTGLAQKQEPPKGGEPKDFTIPEPTVVKLDNGMELYMVQYGAIPKATVQLTLDVGNVDEQAAQNGIADLVADMLKEGTTNMDGKALAAKIAGMGGELSVGVGAHQTSLYSTVLSEFTPKIIALLADVVQQPAFPASELERLKSDMKRQFAVARTRPQTQANEKFNKAIYGDHPYGRSLPTDETVDAYDLAKIKAFYDQHYGAGRAKLYIVGKFDQSAVEQAVRQAFSAWAKGSERVIPKAQPITGATVLTQDRKDSPQATLIIGMPIIDPTHPDYLAVDVMDDLLGGSFASRITSNIRENKGYTYSPYSTISNRYRTSVWAEYADVSIENTGAALTEIAREIYRLRAEPPTARELEGIQNYKAGIFVLQNSSPQGIISQLSFMDFHDLDEDYLNNYVKNVYAVTPDKVQSLARKYLRPELMTLMVVGDEGVVKPQLKEFQENMKQLQESIKP